MYHAGDSPSVVSHTVSREEVTLSITFELCRDERLLEQYYDLREQCFRKELGLPDFDGGEDERDRQGQILIIRQGDRCIGGARIAPGVSVDDQLRELAVNPRASCMWERFVVDPSVRSLKLIRDFLGHLIEFSQKLGYQYAVVLSSLRNARFYRQCHSALGIDFQIHDAVPDCAKGAFAGLEHYLSVSYLRDGQEMRIAA
jgi:GNAT superfamily N-acetyltransferase